MVVLGGVAVSYERGTPVLLSAPFSRSFSDTASVGVHMAAVVVIQGYLAHKNPSPRRTLQ